MKWYFCVLMHMNQRGPPQSQLHVRTEQWNAGWCHVLGSYVLLPSHALITLGTIRSFFSNELQRNLHTVYASLFDLIELWVTLVWLFGGAHRERVSACLILEWPYHFHSMFDQSYLARIWEFDSHFPRRWGERAGGWGDERVLFFQTDTVGWLGSEIRRLQRTSWGW